jgi:hypothetical protein
MITIRAEKRIAFIFMVEMLNRRINRFHARMQNIIHFFVSVVEGELRARDRTTFRYEAQTSHSLIWFTRLSFRWYFTDAHLHNPLPSEEKVKEDHFVHFLRNPVAMTFFDISNYHLYQQSIHYLKYIRARSMHAQLLFTFLSIGTTVPFW